MEKRTEEIKVLMARTASDIVEMGRKLIDVKDRLGHGNWLGWLEVEFEWGDQTARNYMNVSKHLGQIQNGFDFAPRALYALSAPSTPEPARKEALARAKVGETVTHVKAKEIISRGKPEPSPVKPDQQDEEMMRWSSVERD